VFLFSQFFEPLVIDAEVVRYFMLDDPLYFGDNLGIVFTYILDGFLEDSYLIGRYESVVISPLGQGHAFVKSEQGFIPPYPGPS
jgi:hypothetical protein